MIGTIEKKPFYWMLFRISNETDADWYAGRVILMGHRFFLMLRQEDIARLPMIPPQLELDETRLLQRFDDELGGTYFVHQGALMER